MIDSSGRRAMRANGTVLDLLPIGQAIAILGGLLVILFVLLKPEASNGLDGAGRLAFWSLHVVLGLLALSASSGWLASRKLLPCGILASVLVSGCAAVLIATPGYLLLDVLFAPYLVDLDPEPEAASLAAALIQEATDLTPWFMTTWLLINLPVLLPRPTIHPTLNNTVGHDPEDDPTPSKQSPSLSIVDTTNSETMPTPEINHNSDRFLSSLPGIVGTDVVAVASDLHYLNVWTIAGRTTVLGNLRDVVADLGSMGMQVHRSHWVAHVHVRRIVGTAGDAACILSNELRVPISRRRWKAVRDQYGRGVVHTNEINKPTDASKQR